MSCPLCGGAAIRRRFEKQQAPFFRCADCSFEFCLPDANANLENRLEDFEPAYLDYFAETPEDRRNLAALSGWMARRCSIAGAKLVDVGAGGGKLVRHLRGLGAQVSGIEPNVAVFEHFLSGDPAFHRDTLSGFASSAPAASFDAITAFDVIEHVPAPDRFLADASSLLRPGGLLFISTPDVGSLPARLFGRHWHYYNRYHLSYLSKRTLSRLAEASGFEVVEWSRRGRFHSVGFILDYFLQFVAGARGARVPRRLQTWVVPINLFDVLYACLRKPETGK